MARYKSFLCFFLVTVIGAEQADVPCLTENEFKINSCPDNKIVDKPYLLGIEDKNEWLKMCINSKWVNQSKCINSSDKESINYYYPCEEFQPENLKYNTKINKSDFFTFSPFECKDKYFANPLLNYKKHENRQKGMVLCAKTSHKGRGKWFTKNLCLPECVKGESLFTHKCVCAKNKGVDPDKQNTCQTCKAGYFSNGFEECRACNKNYEKVNTKKMVCEMKEYDTVNDKCHKSYLGTNTLLGGNNKNVAFQERNFYCKKDFKKFNEMEGIFACFKEGDYSANTLCLKQCMHQINNTKGIKHLKSNYYEKIEFECKDELALKSDERVKKFDAKCDLGGVWSYSEECVSFCPIKNLNVGNGSIKLTDKQKKATRTSEISFSCNEGFKTNSGETKNIKATCMPGNIWNVNRCTEKIKNGLPVWAIVLIAIISIAVLAGPICAFFTVKEKKEDSGL